MVTRFGRIRRLWSRIAGFVVAGFETMSRYPYDLNEYHWTMPYSDWPDIPDDPHRPDPRREPQKPRALRIVGQVPPPASLPPDARPDAPSPARERTRPFV